MSEHFSLVLTNAFLDSVAAENEWSDLKTMVRQKTTAEPKLLELPALGIWEELLMPGMMPAWRGMLSIRVLIEIVMVLPVHTAECERGFSLMKRIKSDWRSCLGPSTLSDQMMIKLSGITMASFEPDRAISTWWSTSGRPGRHPDAKSHGSRKRTVLS